MLTEKGKIAKIACSADTGKRFLKIIAFLLFLGWGAVANAQETVKTEDIINYQITEKTNIVNDKIIKGEEFVVYQYIGNDSKILEKELYRDSYGVYTETEAIITAGISFVKKNNIWKDVRTATTTVFNFEEETKTTPEKTLLFMPWIKIANAQEISPAVSHGGTVYALNNNPNWATVRNLTTATNASADSKVWIITACSSGNNYGIGRGFTTIKINLPADAEIASSTYYDDIYEIGGNTPDDGNDFIVMVNADPAATSTLATTDFDNIGTTELTNRWDITDLTVGKLTGFVLTEAGIDAISTNGWKVFGWREGHDITNNAPGCPSTANNIALGTNLYNQGTIPFLKIEYSLPAPTSTPPTWSAASSNLAIITASSSTGTTFYYVPFVLFLVCVFWLILCVIFFILMFSYGRHIK